MTSLLINKTPGFNSANYRTSHSLVTEFLWLMGSQSAHWCCTELQTSPSYSAADIEKCCIAWNQLSNRRVSSLDELLIKIAIDQHIVFSGQPLKEVKPAELETQAKTDWENGLALSLKKTPRFFLSECLSVHSVKKIVKPKSSPRGLKENVNKIKGEKIKP